MSHLQTSASTLVGHLNHSNVPISWGPLRYVINSPKMHVCAGRFLYPLSRATGG